MTWKDTPGGSKQAKIQRSLLFGFKVSKKWTNYQIFEPQFFILRFGTQVVQGARSYIYSDLAPCTTRVPKEAAEKIPLKTGGGSECLQSVTIKLDKLEKFEEYFTKYPFLRLSFEYHLTVFLSTNLFSAASYQSKVDFKFLHSDWLHNMKSFLGFLHAL